MGFITASPFLEAPHKVSQSENRNAHPVSEMINDKSAGENWFRIIPGTPDPNRIACR